MKPIKTSLSAVLLAFGLAACSHTGTGTTTSRSAGEFVDDAALTAKVKTEIAQTQGVGRAAEINVNSYNGVVSLAGFVNSKEQARAAVEAARRVSGVREVRNDLEIKK